MTDTRNKRFSSMGLGLPFLRVLPNPDAGAADEEGERLMLVMLYAHGDTEVPDGGPNRGSGPNFVVVARSENRVRYRRVIR